MDRQRVVNNPGLNLQRAVRPELYEEQITDVNEEYEDLYYKIDKYEIE